MSFQILGSSLIYLGKFWICYWHRLRLKFPTTTNILGTGSHCEFFLISTAILLIATNGLYRTQWKCLHCSLCNCDNITKSYLPHYKQRKTVENVITRSSGVRPCSSRRNEIFLRGFFFEKNLGYLPWHLSWLPIISRKIQSIRQSECCCNITF